MEALTFKPEDWGMKRGTENEDFMFLNLGPNHPVCARCIPYYSSA
ncbi:NADH dehydrogenase I chain C; chain D [Salmonella bongori]|nr:NADH dehydrogenase I chain C; chain D [Salmonella bongori]